MSSRDTPTAAAPDSAGEVPSPCNSVCRMDAAGTYCVGCFRTLEEIAGWASFDGERRLRIWKELGERRVRAA